MPPAWNSAEKNARRASAPSQPPASGASEIWNRPTMVAIIAAISSRASAWPAQSRGPAEKDSGSGAARCLSCAAGRKRSGRNWPAVGPYTASLWPKA